MTATTEAAPTAEAQQRGNRGRDRLANPWGKPRFLTLFSWVYILWSIIPVLIAIQFSFNAGRSRSTWQGFSLRWYTGDPDLSVLHNPALRAAMTQSAIRLEHNTHVPPPSRSIPLQGGDECRRLSWRDATAQAVG